MSHNRPRLMSMITSANAYFKFPFTKVEFKPWNGIFGKA